MNDFPFTIIDEDHGLGLLALSGDIDFERVQAFQKSLDDALKRGFKRLIVDMGQITYFNTALGILVKNADEHRKAGGGLALIHVPPKIKIALELLKLDRFFKICDGLASAKQALLEESASTP